ncbi:GNAT family N-acetyltransferase [Planctomycetota bacterium]|nr:GNAT family N-acetyltransferase [Planctomycetota bacterium]
MQLNIQSIPHTQAPLDLLLEADPSESKVKAYLPGSYCYIATSSDGQILGSYVLSPINSTTIELINIAVHPDHHRQGIGGQLLVHAIQSARNCGAKQLVLGTGSFGPNLVFYHKHGFRVTSIIHNFFIDNYAEPIYLCGIQLKDMLRLALELS